MSNGDRPHLGVGQVLANKYEIIEDINTGSFGHVVLCRNTANKGKKVAVKVQDRAEPRYHQGATCSPFNAVVTLRIEMSTP